ncbi:MAG: murein biosynthesis integral membrane protein MurJ [Candidatus Omnitrophota bacterium]|jgi:putative peptidoglycan lipid II flippase
MSTHKSLAKSAGVIGLGISASRILGFIRDIIIAAMFGTTLYADAFFTAFRIPNLWRDLVGEGAANAAFVPVLSGYAANKSKEEFWELARIILNVMVIVLAVITLLGIIFAPLIVSAIAWGFLGNPEKFKLTVTLTRMMFPYIFLIGLTAYATGVLNSRKLFGATSFSQPLWNLVFILSAIFICPLMKEPVTGLAIGVLLGGIVQLAVQLPPLMKMGMGWPRFDRFKHPASNEIGRLLLPRVFGSSVYQLNVFLDTALASLSDIVGKGAISAINYANRLWLLPLAIFSTAFSQAMLPTLSEHAARNEMEKFKQALSFSLRAVFFITIPAAVGLMALSEPIVRALFQRGSFDAYSTSITAPVLFYFSIGLCAYAGVKPLVSAFYSLKDTRTPVKNAVMVFLLNAALNFILMFPMKVNGLALATSLASIFNFFSLYFLLRKKIGPLGGREIFVSFVRAAIPGAIMAVVLILLNVNLQLRPVPKLAVIIPAGAASFFIACLIFDVKEFKGFVKWILRRG